MSKQAATQHKALSAREREVLAFASQGKSARDIGAILGITKRTVDHHTQTASRKLGASNKVAAVALAIRYGIIDP
jgi:LuxR family quorum sensing-dependent transcriptional regulator